MATKQEIVDEIFDLTEEELDPDAFKADELSERLSAIKTRLAAEQSARDAEAAKEAEQEAAKEAEEAAKEAEAEAEAERAAKEAAAKEAAAKEAAAKEATLEAERAILAPQGHVLAAQSEIVRVRLGPTSTVGNLYIGNARITPQGGQLTRAEYEQYRDQFGLEVIP